ncbi:MAG: YihY/virulence factor BrkB family protein [Gammaproteobacteria bacterium]|jgi:YihY family inner membrane protein
MPPLPAGDPRSVPGRSTGRLQYVLGNPWLFVRSIIAGFRANQGFLLAGAVAYYTLLSLVPVLALILIALSQLTDLQPLLETTREYLGLVAPVQAPDLTEQIAAFLRDWKLVGGLGLVMLVIFSSFAFTTLENAMSVIFFHRVAIHRRHFLISAIIPYCYILFLALGLFLVSTVSGVLHTLDDQAFTLMGHTLSLHDYDAGVLYTLGVIGEILLLSSLYLVMPTGRLAIHHALVGGITATILWELTRHFMVWYFSTLSIINVVYGTFATAIIVLLSLEAAAVILLLGAQVISEYERIDVSGDDREGLQT